MSAANSANEFDLVVAEDGSIPAEQVAALGVPPGTHLRVVATTANRAPASIAGRLTSWPDVSWEDFDRASELAKADLSRS
jgi:hypothetical protein